jgi:glycosyltransferase involved in cell wall biosynthesis
LSENRESISEILLVVCQRTRPDALATCEKLTRLHPGLIQTRFQQRPFLGGAIRDAFDWARGTHVLMMASDLETEPSSVKDLIRKAGEGYDIVTATRWSENGGFHGYEPVKYVLNWLFQRSFRLLYGTALSDLTYGYRIFKAKWVKEIAWEELKHPFLLETILKPLRLGATVAEIATVWRTRQEGVSHNSFLQTLLYLRPALTIRFTPRHALLAAREDALVETRA